MRQFGFVDECFILIITIFTINTESNLSKGIPRDARERYEIVFSANMDEDGYISSKFVDLFTFLYKKKKFFFLNFGVFTNETLLGIGDVVKEIYMRSRLDKKTLSKIW